MSRYSKVQKNTYTFLALMPFLTIYFILFHLSMKTAPDRGNYVWIVSNPFQGREEPGISVFAYFFGKFADDPEIILLLFQFFSLSFIVTTFSLYYSKSYLIKLYISFFLLMTVMSNQYGIQIRIGFASSMFLFLSLGLRLKATLSNSVWYIIPILFHNAMIPITALYYLISYFKVKSDKRFIFLFMGISVFGILIFSQMSKIIVFFGFNPYYLGYFGDSAIKNERLIPFSVIFYFICCVYLCLVGRKTKKDLYFYLNFMAIPLVLVAFLNQSVIFFKFATPFIHFTVVYIVAKLTFSDEMQKLLLPVSVLMAFLGFFYYLKVVGLSVSMII